MSYIHRYIEELKQTLADLPEDRIEQVVQALHEARLNNQQVFIMGNGGSASTASHFVCDLGKNTRVKGVPNFRVMGLTDNMALFSALANDEGYDNVFMQQLASHIQPGDVVIGISTSGNSPNVVKAIQLANTIPAKTIGFTGYESGKLGGMVDIDLHVPSHLIEHIEDIHLVLEHLICKELRDKAMELLDLEESLAVTPEVAYQDEKLI
jgi:D-sedoheptulose 7-phosphate isomerase